MDIVDRTVLVLTGGDAVDASVAPLLPDAALVVAADGGVASAAALGLHVDLVVGDLDSASPEALAGARAAGAAVERHRADKDATDLELALRAACREGATRIVVVGGAGGRLDHLLANVDVLCAPAWAGVGVEALVGRARLTVVRDRAVLAGVPGEYVSLLAVGGPATGVVTAGLRFPLRGETLQPGSSRGVSNEFVAPVASVEVAGGVVLAVAPGEIAPTPSDQRTGTGSAEQVR